MGNVEKIIAKEVSSPKKATFVIRKTPDGTRFILGFPNEPTALRSFGSIEEAKQYCQSEGSDYFIEQKK